MSTIEATPTASPAYAHETRTTGADKSAEDFSQYFSPLRTRATEAIPRVGAERLSAILSGTPQTDPDALARIEAAQIMHDQVSPLYQKIGKAFQEIRDLFADMDVPFADAVQISRGGDGRFHVSGWGVGVEVSHPQGAFIEAVLNGDIPQLSDVSEEIAALVDDIEGWHGQIQDFKAEMADLTGEPFTRAASIFDANVVLGAEYVNRTNAEARQLAMKDPLAFQQFQDSLGDELEHLSYDQVLARFHFAKVDLPALSERYPDYFA